MKKKSSKVILRLCGGLGNQLFMYAAAYSLSKRLDAELVIDEKSGFTSDKKYKRKYSLEYYPLVSRFSKWYETFYPSPYLRIPLIKIYELLWNRRRVYFYSNFVNSFDSNFLEISAPGVYLIQGYWQSEKYFDVHINDIKKMFSPRLDLINSIVPKNFLNELKVQRNSCSLHIRNFDSSQSGSNRSTNLDSLSSSYYTRAIEKIISIVGLSCRFYVFSDDVDYARNILDKIKLKDYFIVSVVCEGASPVFDLMLMSLCQHHIIANSTFSWWGAWLGANPSKVVIVPKLCKFDTQNHVGDVSWGFDSLIPANWIEI